MRFKNKFVSGVPCPKCSTSNNIHPHGSKNHSGIKKIYYKCYGCGFIFVNPLQRERPIGQGLKKSNTGRKKNMTMTARKTLVTKSFRGKGNASRLNESFNPLPPPLAIKKPPSTLESIADIPCFRNCANSFKPCDPSTCNLLDEWLGLRQFPLACVVI